MMTPPSRIHHVNKRNPLNDAVMSKSDSPGCAMAALKEMDRLFVF